jgi:hypothetical protein
LFKLFLRVRPHAGVRQHAENGEGAVLRGSLSSLHEPFRLLSNDADSLSIASELVWQRPASARKFLKNQASPVFRKLLRFAFKLV